MIKYVILLDEPIATRPTGRPYIFQVVWKSHSACVLTLVSTCQDLTLECETAGLNGKGNKGDLVNRLAQHLCTKPVPPTLKGEVGGGAIVKGKDTTNIFLESATSCESLDNPPAHASADADIWVAQYVCQEVQLIHAQQQSLGIHYLLGSRRKVKKGTDKMVVDCLYTPEARVDTESHVFSTYLQEFLSTKDDYAVVGWVRMDPEDAGRTAEDERFQFKLQLDVPDCFGMIVSQDDAHMLYMLCEVMAHTLVSI